MPSQGETISTARPGTGDDLKAGFTYVEWQGKIEDEIDALMILAGDVCEPDNHLAVSAKQFSKRTGLSTSASQARLDKLVEEGSTRKFKTRRAAEDGKLRPTWVWLRIDKE
jgi:hypothetical protein